MACSITVVWEIPEYLTGGSLSLLTQIDQYITFYMSAECLQSLLNADSLSISDTGKVFRDLGLMSSSLSPNMNQPYHFKHVFLLLKDNVHIYKMRAWEHRKFNIFYSKSDGSV